MCLGCRPTFHSSTSFLPKEPSLELPTVFRRKASNNTLDLGVWPDRRHGLPISQNRSAESLAHGVGVFIFLPQHVKNVKLFFSFPFFFFFSSWENSCQWMQCPFQIQYYANCISASGVNKYVREAAGCTETELPQCVAADPPECTGAAGAATQPPLPPALSFRTCGGRLRAWDDGPRRCPVAGNSWSHVALGRLWVRLESSLAGMGDSCPGVRVKLKSPRKG